MNINWKSLCYQMNHASFHSEADIENLFGSILDTAFGWHTFDGKLKHQVPVTVGHQTKKADIVLYKDQKPFVIEMKGIGIVPQQAETDQLKSYMKILGSEYGMIANDKEMYLYYSAFQSPKIDAYARIPYDENSADGSEFASILTYDTYSLDKMEAFRKKKQSAIFDQKMGDELAAALCSGNSGKQLLIDALRACESIRTQYNDNAIAIAVEQLQIKKSALPPSPPPPPHPAPPSVGFTGFDKKGLPIGTVLVFKGDHSITAVVAGDKEVSFEGSTYKLSALAKKLYARIGKLTPSGAYRGAAHFLYNGTIVLSLPDVK